MPGPALLLLMLVPLVAAWVVAGRYRDELTSASPLIGMALIPVVVLAVIAAPAIGDQLGVDPTVVNRLSSCLILVAGGALLALNRHQTSRLVRWGGLLAVGGAAGNALATLVYGAMPVLASSAVLVGSDATAGARLDAEYVAVDARHLPALLLGDVLPAPPLHSVLSLGDLALVPGATLVLAACIAPLLTPGRGSGVPSARTRGGET